MKQITSVIAFLTVALFSFAQPGKQPFMTKSFANANIKNVVTSTFGGSLSIEGVPASQEKVDVYITSNNGGSLSNDEIQKILNEDYSIEITLNGTELQVIAKKKSNGNNKLSIAFKIYAPSAASAQLKTSGGSIAVNNISGGVKGATSGGSISLSKSSGNMELATSGGSITASDCKGNISLKTSGGSLQLDELDGTIDAATSGGSITASGIKGTASLKTSGGSIQLSKLNGKIEAATSGGSVKVNDAVGSLMTKTSGGSVRLDNIAANIDAATSAGSISLVMTASDKTVNLVNGAGAIDIQLPGNGKYNLDLQGSKVNAGSLSNFDGKNSDKSLAGKINGGGTSITAKAGTGKVSLSLK